MPLPADRRGFPPGRFHFPGKYRACLRFHGAAVLGGDDTQLPLDLVIQVADCQTGYALNEIIDCGGVKWAGW